MELLHRLSTRRPTHHDMFVTTNDKFLATTAATVMGTVVGFVVANWVYYRVLSSQHKQWKDLATNMTRDQYNNLKEYQSIHQITSGSKLS